MMKTQGKLASYEELQFAAESALEASFFHDLVSRGCGPFLQIVPQYSVGSRRLDLMLQRCSGMKIGIELDGAAYHQDRAADWNRDTEILASGQIDEIVRIPFSAAYFHIHGTLAVLGGWYHEFHRFHNLTWSWQELLNACNTEVNPNGDYRSREAFLNSIEDSVDVYEVLGRIGFACSPKTAFNRANPDSKLKYIERRPSTRLRQNQ